MTTSREFHRARLAQVNWGLLGVLFPLHVSVIVAPFTFSWGAVATFLSLHWIAGCLGVTLAFHRLLSHRALRVARPIEVLLALCGCLALQGPPITWVTNHRKHHTSTDRAGDPHSPQESFWWGHVGWLILGHRRFSPETLARQYAPELLADPFYRFLQRSYLVYPVLLGAGLYWLGGWGYVVWGLALRTVVFWHSTWFVNSAAHLWGYRRFRTKDRSTNLWWVSLLTYGEGWHNNHHADPRAARFGRSFWEMDPTWGLIRLLEALGLAWDVRRPRRTVSPVAPGS